MKNALIKLIDLKSLITILLVITLTVLVLNNITIADETMKTLFVSIISSVFTYYFTRKPEDNKNNGENT